jgi:mandelamide amidase
MNQTGASTRIDAGKLLDALAGNPCNAVACLGAGPAAGQPIVVKDNIDVVGLRSTASSPLFAAAALAERSAPVVERLAAAGYWVAAKTNMHELAFGVTGRNAHTGDVSNPAVVDAIAGGSSSGTAALIASGHVAGGLGTDTGGSTRIPAAFCGIVGFRPSFWEGRCRYPLGGVIPLAPSRDVVGPMGRTASDVVMLDAAMAEMPPAPAIALQGLRVRLGPFHAWQLLDPALRPAMEAFVTALGALGAVVDRAPSDTLREQADAIGGPLTLAEARAAIAESVAERVGLRRWAEVVAQVASPDVARLLAASDTISTEDLDRARRARLRLRTNFVERFGDAEIMVAPTVPVTAGIIGRESSHLPDSQSSGVFKLLITTTDVDSLAGLPSITVPIGMSQAGEPVGALLIGLPGRDVQVLGLALALERARLLTYRTVELSEVDP